MSLMVPVHMDRVVCTPDFKLIGQQGWQV